METVTACCSQCEHRLGSLLNLWTQIGNTYISPVVQHALALDISSEGVIRHGEIGTIVDGCRVQTVVCNQCRSVLGSRCLSSAVNHVLHEGQLVLQASSIQIKGLDGHGTIQPTIQRLLNLKNPPSDEVRPEGAGNYNQRQATDGIPELDLIVDEVDAQREKIERLNTAGYQAVAFFNHVVQQIDEKVRNLNNKIVQVTDDLSGHSTKTKGLADDILSTRTEIKEIQSTLQSLTAQSQQESSSVRNIITKANASLRIELCDKWGKQQQQLNLLEPKLESARQDLEDFQASFESTRTTAKATLLASKANAEEIVALRNELQHLRQELALERSYKPSTTNRVIAASEMDILTSNITKIGQRASQVETLQMEFELLKGRVQRMEAQTTTSQRDSSVSLQQQEPHLSQLVNSKCKASPIYPTEDGINFGSLSAVPNVSDGHASQSPTASATPLNSPPHIKARRDSSRTGIPKLTKSGAVDKRTLKKSGSKSATTVRKVKAT
ncbi:hypothetical protein F4803DRAFT_384201 [Xylaria telfairii]|nr:hypothetical protein F4803DRAFT_384201 [Xylaria telfairii]